MKTQSSHLLVTAICITLGLPVHAADKKMTTYQRQNNLMNRVNDAQKSNQLTVKQAKKFRHQLSKIAVKKQKEIARSAAGNLGEKTDMSKVEDSM